MTWWRCPHCGRRGEPDDARTGTQWPSAGEPGYQYDGCRICTPDGDDLDEAKDTTEDRQASDTE